jgi:hypothetical protein
MAKKERAYCTEVRNDQSPCPSVGVIGPYCAFHTRQALAKVAFCDGCQRLLAEVGLRHRKSA